MNVVVVGSLNIDYIASVKRLPAAAETVAATGLVRRFGGKGANQAVAAARQGARVSMIGCVGADVGCSLRLPDPPPPAFQLLGSSRRLFPADHASSGELHADALSRGGRVGLLLRVPDIWRNRRQWRSRKLHVHNHELFALRDHADREFAGEYG